MNINKDKRYSINRVLLCTFDKSLKGFIKINSEHYPERWCVIDTEYNKVIDIKMGLQYDFIPTLSGLHLASQSANLIKENKRAAVFQITTFEYEDGILELGNEIINNLKAGYEYPDGNDTLNETEYFEALELEKANEEKKQFKKIKKRRI